MVIGALQGPWRFVDDELVYENPEGFSLLGARCQDCTGVGVTTFPYQASCPRCGGERMAPVQLPRRGKLWSFTIQRFRPPAHRTSAEDFAPYAVGYVDLGSVIVEARIDEADPARLTIGHPVSLCTLPIYEADGMLVHTYAFRLETD